LALAPGSRLGAYEVTALIGEGGMGQVYRARDTKLNRDVALKVLPDSFASDPERLARFTREAQTLASLNHPNIGGIHGLEESNCVTALVMELVEGEDLAQRIARGAIPLDDALPIARQIAEALEAAHEQGIIHRDLKPANIKVRTDGTVKVLDFGLAKAMDPPAASRNVSQSPTITTPAMTHAGMILGTAAYMSPEQARGKPVDKRTDIWAFGCVLYEMLTGTRAFAGDDVSEVLASVLAREPDWSRLPAALSPGLGTCIRRCLQKNPKQRIGDAQDVRLALEGAFDSVVPPTSAAVVSMSPASWRRMMTITASAVALAAVAGASGVWLFLGPTEPVSSRVSRLQIVPSSAAALTLTVNQRHVAITPDGSRVIYVGNRGTQLFVRSLDALDAVAVFTGLPRGPFVSPDSKWIGFSDAGALKKVLVNGGPAATITTIDGPTSNGATWGPDDTIIFGTSNGATGLQRVSAAGGPTTVLTRPDAEHGEADHAFPEWLPGGRAVLFTITALTGGLDAARVAVLDLQTGTRKVLVAGSHAHFVRGGFGSKRVEGGGGHLVYATAGTLRAVPFNLDRLETYGAPIAVIQDVATAASGGVDAVVADDGTLAYVSGSAVGTARTLAWVDRQGRETPIPAPTRGYVHPRLSPDDARVAVFAADQELDLWLSDLGPTLTRLTAGPGADFSPVWMPDGRLIFTSQRNSPGNLFRQAADGTGVAERLTESPNAQQATAISRDGRTLIFTETAPKTGEDVMQMTLETRRVTPLVQSSFSERNGTLSPDGRWLAYESNENSSQFEIFVRPYPEVNTGHWLVSTAGGNRPLWARNGQELIYVSPTGALMRVGVVPGSSWVSTPPTLLVKEGYYTSPLDAGRTFDISADGQRLLMIKDAGADATAVPASLIVVQHWVEELKRLVPTK
jgi:eukaryotic-like serine/threonine-protein kinase